MGFLSYIFNNRPSISYAITVCNEHKEIDQLLASLLPKLRDKDEVVVLQDITEKNEQVSEILNKYADRIKVSTSKLNADFATFKNELIPMASCDYLFQIDADELIPDSLIKKLPAYLALKSKYDCFNVPRKNTVAGITDEHIKKWNWQINKDGYINYPDWQMRIFKLDPSNPIKWKNKVHEVLVGYKKVGRLKGKGYEFAIIHNKEIKKQEQQNEFYDNNF